MTNKRLVTLGIALAVASCADDGKGKADLATNVGTSIDAFETAAGGTWNLVQIVESAHPYTNNLRQQLVVRGAADTTEMRVDFDRFELEAGYDFVEIRGAGDPTRHTGDLSGQQVLVAGNSVTITLTTDYSVTDWGVRIRVFELEPCTCTEQYQPVCGADDTTYDNSCFAQCAGVAVAHSGECRQSGWMRVPLALESDHPYTNDYDYTWEIREAGASNIRVHFATIDVERGYDFVRVLDANDRVIATYTGVDTNVTTPDIPGDTARIQLATDYSVTRWGFAIDGYEVTAGCNVDADCGPGRVCTQVQCIRAPCLAICEAAGGVTTYQDVTLAELGANANSFNGQMIRVTGEPSGTARCTRRGCPASNPCCNTCSASLVLGQNIEIRDASGQGYGCSGDECSWQSTCRAFQPQDNGPFLFEGRFNVDQYGARYITVDSYRAADCQRRGCAGQVCSNSAGVATICDQRPEYACYAQALCEPQRGGHCGFTQTPELQQCIANAGNPQAATVASADTPLAIPDNDTRGASSVIPLQRSGTVSSVSVSVAITHTYRGDLVVTLVSPEGTRHAVHDRAGGSADDVIVQDLVVNAFNGEVANGTWRLEIVDTARADVGTLEGWSLTIQ